MDREHLAEVLTALRQKAASSEAEGIAEAATKSQFVEPILTALGYEGLADIEWEHHIKASGEHIDYVLKVRGRPAVAIEAKSLGTELTDKHAAQVVQYASVEGIEWCLLTNGRQIRVYSVTVKGDLAAKHLADLDLETAEPDEVLDVLSLFSKEGLGRGDVLSEWARSTTVDRMLRLILLNADTPAIGQLASTLAASTGLDVTPDELTHWFAKVLAPTPTPAPAEKKSPQHQIARSSAYWLLPARPGPDGADSVQELHRWLDAGMWAMGRSTPRRKHMQPGDFVCFYATGIGVAAWARLAGLPNELVTVQEWPEPTPMEGERFKVPLRDVRWLPRVVPIDEELRPKLDAFQGKSSRIWSWFVQTTSKLSEHDFRLLTGES